MEHLVSLTEMLDARERRALRQQRLLDRYGCPLICFTMNIAGPVKSSSLIRRGFELGKQELTEKMAELQFVPLHTEEVHETTGSEAYFVLNQDPLQIKKITSEIEDQNPSGRLFDMDVLTADGKKVERTELGLPPRSCLICGKPARECSRSRSHSVAELQEKTRHLLMDAAAPKRPVKCLPDTEDKSAGAKKIAALACRALLYEVCTTPKPGLVDRFNSGSHKDMDIFTFMDSASALWPYFETCAGIGRETASLPPAETFHQLRQAGRSAESHMFAATKGVNTHKGAIFSMGIVCGALGRLPQEGWSDSDRILDLCAEMTRGLSVSDFAGITKETASTNGQRLYLQYGITGIRGQIEEGLPAVRKAGLPVLKEGIARGLSLNDAGCAALLSLMVNSTDTNLIARSSLSTQQETVKTVKALLEINPYPDQDTLIRIDQEFIKKNLSPGGSADLLAICYLLYFLQQAA